MSSFWCNSRVIGNFNFKASSACASFDVTAIGAMLLAIEICGYVPEKDQILPNVQLHDLLFCFVLRISFMIY
jgi:hypothetical protein